MKTKMMKIKSLEELMVGVKEEERKRKAVLAKRGRDQFKKKGRR
jgi:hypothetical protein